MILYFHDTPNKLKSQVAANRSNIDTIESIENYIQKNRDVVLSADDGYKSVKNLLSLLEKYDVKLLFFVTTGFIDEIVYPYEVELSNFLEQNSSCLYDGKSFLLEALEEKESFFKSLHKKLKPLSLKTRENFVFDFFKENNTDKKTYQKDIFMTWRELKEIAKHPMVEIGSHCVSHLFLPSQNLKNIYYELKESKKILEEKLECTITKVSYPYGGNNLKVRLLARLAGYKEGYGTHNKNSTQMNIARSELKDLI